MARLVIFGAGGCAGDILRTARKFYEVIELVSDQIGGELLGIPIQSPSIIDDSDELLVALGDGAARRRVIERFPANKLATIIAPTAIIGDEVELGEGACLSDYAVITSRSCVGRNLQMNLKASIGHDCRVGDDVTISPHVAICSSVHIGAGVFIGTGSILKTGRPSRILHVGTGAHIACGSVVFHNVPAGALVAGNPARLARQFLAVARKV